MPKTQSIYRSRGWKILSRNRFVRVSDMRLEARGLRDFISQRQAHHVLDMGPVTYSAVRALAELHAQHEMLRGMMDRCEELADALDAGGCGPTQLTREVARLRLAFEAHNTFEEQMIRPVLLRSIPKEAMERLYAAHVEDHLVMRRQLATTETTPLREVIASMRAHLEAEETYLATQQSVRVVAPAE